MTRRTLLLTIGVLALAATDAWPADPASPQSYKSEGDTTTRLFGIEAKGSKFAYVFDRSDSMGDAGGKPLREAKKQLQASLNDLDERQQFYLVFYNERPRLLDLGQSHGRLIFATPANKRQADEFISGIRADGGTNHIDALITALQLRPDVVFLLTDGEEKDDPTPDELKRIDRINEGSSIIHVVHFADSPRPGSSLVKLAEQNRGQHVFVDIKHWGEQKK